MQKRKIKQSVKDIGILILFSSAFLGGLFLMGYLENVWNLKSF